MAELFFTEKCTLLVQACNFIFCSSVNGGAYAANSSITIIEVTNFTFNTCSKNGGAIYFDRGELALNRVIFFQNDAGTVSGCVDISDGTLQTYFCGFVNNRAKFFNSAINLSNVEGQIEKSIFSHNNVENVDNYAGGCIYISKSSKTEFMIVKCTFTLNSGKDFSRLYDVYGYDHPQVQVVECDFGQPETTCLFGVLSKNNHFAAEFQNPFENLLQKDKDLQKSRYLIVDESYFHLISLTLLGIPALTLISYIFLFYIK